MFRSSAILIGAFHQRHIKDRVQIASRAALQSQIARASVRRSPTRFA